MPLLLIGIPKGNLQFKLELLALNLWEPELLQIKSLTSGTLSYILESESVPRAICLVTTNLYLTVQAYPPPLCPRNQLWLHIIESEKPLLQDISNSTGKMENPICRHSQQTLEVCKHLASPEASSGRVTHMSSLPRGE